MPDGNPYGRSPTGGDPRQRRALQVSQGFLNQGPPGSTTPRTRPSTYPDVRGFASTPVGRMLLKSVLERMQGAGTRGGRPAPRR